MAKKKFPTHEEFDWHNRHTIFGHSQQTIAKESGVPFEKVVESIRYVSKWLVDNFKSEYDVLRNRNLMRLENLIVNCMSQAQSGSLDAAKEARMCIHEWMDITGGIEGKKQTSDGAPIVLINNMVERMLETGQSVNSEMLQKAKRIRDVESKLVGQSK